jgi:MoaA/NifB/PqqE/SkfB family radical SAM enzyme
MYPTKITGLHIELTDRCQASCPMCARNVNGGREREFVGKNEITLEQFKKWLPVEFISNLNSFYSCGNYGDPIIAKDCLEIYQYVRSINATCRLGIHTNGSARDKDWWQELAVVLGDNHMCTFGIDGFEDSHVLYRRGTSWTKIIENAKSFIAAGGKAEIDCLVFKHNQNEISNFRNQMLDIGFSKINLKFTKRFYDMKQFPVENRQGEIEYFLEPAVQEYPIEFLPLEKISKDISIWKDIVEQSTLEPKCISKNEIYIDARGNAFPCCWIGSDWVEQPIKEILAIQKLRNLVVEDTKKKFQLIGTVNLNTTSINDLPWKNLKNELEHHKPWTCVKNCNGRN